MHKRVHGVEQDLPVAGHRAGRLGHRRGLRLAEPDIPDLQHKREHNSQVQVRSHEQLEQVVAGHRSASDSGADARRVPKDIERPERTV